MYNIIHIHTYIYIHIYICIYVSKSPHENGMISPTHLLREAFHLLKDDGCNEDHLLTSEKWRFPKSWGYPQSSIYRWIFHEINQL